MSDFDREAEREKLREKYGDEADERAATRQMSELLLKGATMTNKHCDTCGDPIFRYDGQEFCPTCDGADTAGDAATTDTGTDTETVETTAQGDGRQVEVDTPDGDTERGGMSSTGSGHRHQGTERSNVTDATPSPSVEESEVTETTSTPSIGSGKRRPADEVTDDLRAGRRSLERTLARFARAAAESDDPRAAREHLAAAREAAEALTALRR